MNNMDPAPIDFVRGDDTGMMIPAHPDALRTGGVEFLTKAFQTFGALAADNRVTKITRFEKCPGGSTGQKLFLSVEYEKPSPELHTDLFVKFSRDFTDPIRDSRGKVEMTTEIGFAPITRQPGFPINVPVAYFADFHRDTYTGFVITQRIPFGVGKIEPHRHKAHDHKIPNPVEYYRAIMKALGRIAGSHRAGKLSPDVARRMPYDPNARAMEKIHFDEAKLRSLVAEYADFCDKAPQLFPANIRTPEFIAKLERETVRFLKHEQDTNRFLQSNPDLIALCHWNANIDNAWFWRDEKGEVQVGLIDWGNVNQLNLSFPIWGCLSAANIEIWDDHLDELLGIFLGEIHRCGGPRIDIEELKLHLAIYMGHQGTAYFIASPGRILFRLPEAIHATSPRDPLLEKSETACNQIVITSACMNLWQRYDFGACLDRALARIGA
jgi:hypothetical protein